MTSLESQNYACMMPALINDWRAHWSAASGTDANFPFGIVQLSAYGGATGMAPANEEHQLRRRGRAHYGWRAPRRRSRSTATEAPARSL